MNGSAPHCSLREIRISCLSAHIGLPTYCYFSIIPADRKEKHYTLHSWLASYGVVCVCVRMPVCARGGVQVQSRENCYIWATAWPVLVT